MGISVLKPQIVFLDNWPVHVKKEKKKKRKKEEEDNWLVSKHLLE